MNNNKQSSVEWLISQLKISTYWNNLISELELMECGEIATLQQAKAMHKEEIENAYSRGWEKSVQYEIQRSEEEDAKRFTPRNYYNKTFGGNNDN